LQAVYNDSKYITLKMLLKHSISNQLDYSYNWFRWSLP